MSNMCHEHRFFLPIIYHSLNTPLNLHSQKDVFKNQIIHFLWGSLCCFVCDYENCFESRSKIWESTCLWLPFVTVPSHLRIRDLGMTVPLSGFKMSAGHKNQFVQHKRHVQSSAPLLFISLTDHQQPSILLKAKQRTSPGLWKCQMCTFLLLKLDSFAWF